MADKKAILARNLLGFVPTRLSFVAKLHVESGWVPKHTVHAFGRLSGSVCEPMFAKPLKDIPLASY